MNGESIGSGYVLQRKIGGGAMGSVWIATDQDGAEVACKVLRPEFAEDPAVVARFVGERTALLRIRDPHVVTMRDLVVDAGRLAIIMDLVRGPDMRAALRNVGTFAPAEVARVGAAVASGLAAVHAQGVVHRDVKPENILMDMAVTPPAPRISDFGLARVAETSAATRSSLALGTPNYMAPEIGDGQIATPAADVYSLGIVLYEMACGVTPFEGGSQLATIRRHGDALAGRPEGVPDALWSTIVACLGKDPASRPGAAALASRLSQIQQTLADVPAAAKLTAPPAPIEVARSGGEDSGATAVMPAVQQPAPPPPTPAPAATAQAAAAEVRAPKKRRGRLIAVVGLLVVGLIGAGAAWAVLNNRDTVPATPSASAEGMPEASATAEASASATPSAGATVASSASPSAASGATASGTMPNVVGKALSETRSLFPGVDVVTELEYDETKPDNTVVGQKPAAGEPMGGTVTLTVARRPVTMYLADMRAIESGFSNCSSFLSGTAYPKSVCTGSWSSTKSSSWNLSKGFRRVQAVVGRSDTASNAEAQVKVEAFLDQRSVWSETVSLGKPVELDIDVAEGLRLKLEVTSLKSSDGADIVFGDLKALGLPGEVPEQKE